MTEPLKVGVIGRDGRMGKAATAWIESEDGFDLVGTVGRGEGWTAIKSATVCLDLTRAGLGGEHARRLLETGIRPLIGTSGVSRPECESISELANRLDLGGAVVPNFSVGAHLLLLAAKAAKSRLDSALIVEGHHTKKADAPSATAIQLAQDLDLDPSLVISLRMDGLTAMHEVRMWAENETLTLRHESRGLSGFRHGIIQGLRYASQVKGVTYGLAAVLGETCKLELEP